MLEFLDLTPKICAQTTIEYLREEDLTNHHGKARFVGHHRGGGEKKNKNRVQDSKIVVVKEGGNSGGAMDPDKVHPFVEDEPQGEIIRNPRVYKVEQALSFTFLTNV